MKLQHKTNSRKWSFLSQTLRNLLMILFFALYFIFLYFLFLQKQAPNSDTATHLLEAQDIVHGNFLLSGWMLAGVSFIASDLIIFCIGYLVAGISVEAEAISMALVFTLFAIVVLLLIRCGHDKNKFWGYLFFLMWAAIPGSAMIYFARIHLTSVIESLFALWLLYATTLQKSHNIKTKVGIILSTLIFALAAQSDMIAIVSVILPMILVSGWYVLASYLQTGKINRKFTTLLCVGIIAIILGQVDNALFYRVGGANELAYLNRKNFVSLHQFHDNTLSYFNNVLSLTNANFFHQKLYNIDTIVYFFRVLIIAVTYIFIFYNIYRCIKKQRHDFIATVLSCGVALVTMIYLTVDGLGKTRYITFLPTFIAVIFIRTISTRNINWRKLHGLAIIKIFTGIILFCLLSVQIIPLPNGSKYYLRQQGELLAVLQENNLSNGYSVSDGTMSYWYGAIMRLLSHDTIHVMSTQIEPNYWHIFNWFAKKEWYTQPANFIVMEKATMDNIYVNIEDILGEPVETFETQDVYVFVYDYDITSKLSNGLADNIMKGHEWKGDSLLMTDDGQRILESGSMLWGPYSPVNAGKYRIVCTGDNIDHMQLDVFSNQNDNLIVPKSEARELEFELERDMNDLEIRIYNETADDMAISECILEKR